MSVSGEVYCEGGSSQRHDDGVPRVGVLATTVEKHDLGIIPVPCQHAKPLLGRDLNRQPSDGRAPIPGDSGPFGVALEGFKLVIVRNIFSKLGQEK